MPVIIWAKLFDHFLRLAQETWQLESGVADRRDADDRRGAARMM